MHLISRAKQQQLNFIIQVLLEFLLIFPLQTCRLTTMGLNVLWVLLPCMAGGQEEYCRFRGRSVSHSCVSKDGGVGSGDDGCCCCRGGGDGGWYRGSVILMEVMVGMMVVVVILVVVVVVMVDVVF